MLRYPTLHIRQAGLRPAFLGPCHSLIRSFSSSRTLSADTSGIRKADDENPPVGRPDPGPRDQLSFFPFALIFALGTGLYVLIVRSREGTAPRPEGASTQRGELPFKRNRDKAKQKDYEQD